MVLYEDLYHNVLELEVHDGCHRLLLWAEQSWPEDHTQIGDSHQVLLVVIGHTVERVGGVDRERVSGYTFKPN